MLVRSWIRPALLVASLTWSGVAWAQAPAAPSEGDAVAVLPLELVGSVPAGRPALEAAVVRGLTMFTGTTVEATQTSARLIAAGAKLPCEDAACWTAAGKAAGARHLVAGRVERKGANFEVQFRLFEAASGRLLATETNKCEAVDCSVAELTRTTVRELARTMLTGSPASAPIPAAAPAVLGATNADEPGLIPTAPAASVQTGVATDQGPSAARRLLPYVGMAAAVGVLGAGVWLIDRDGSCKVEAAKAMECNTIRATMVEGVAFTGVGAALLATSVVVAITDHLDARDRTALLIGPGTLVLRGRF